MDSNGNCDVSKDGDVHKYGVIVGTKVSKTDDGGRNEKQKISSALDATVLEPCQHCLERKRLQDIPVEIFRYKVVYPGGVFVRISPALEAEKTGVILEYGTVFEAIKSLVLDGVNYAKLSDGSGWVFGNKGETEILDLIEVIRVPASLLKNNETKCSHCNGVGVVHATNGQSNSTPSNSGISSSRTPGSFGTVNLHDSPMDGFQRMTLSRAQQERNKLFQIIRVENRFWREVRVRCSECTGFEDFANLVATIDMQGPGGQGTSVPSTPDGGQSRTSWSAENRQDQQIRNCISLIVSITGQCVEALDMQGLEASLWVLVHMGSKVSHAMQLVVEHANARFEQLSSTWQAELLRIVLEVGSRTKVQSVELGKLTDILPDDIRNFLQRWVIIKAVEPEKDSNHSVSGDDAEEDSGAHAFSRTPVTEHPRPSSWFSSFMCAPTNPCGSGVSNNNTQQQQQQVSDQLPPKSKSILPDCSSGLPRKICSSSLRKHREGSKSKDSIAESDQSSGNDSAHSDNEEVSKTATKKRENSTAGRFWNEVERQVMRLTNPDVQFAGLI